MGPNNLLARIGSGGCGFRVICLGRVSLEEVQEYPKEAITRFVASLDSPTAHNREVTESELAVGRAMLLRQREGWRYLESERLAAIRAVVTKDALPSFQSSFEFAQKLPPRLESGFTAFYAALSRGSGRCSI